MQKAKTFYHHEMKRNTFNMIDKRIHAHKRKILARCFTDTALAQLEDYMIKSIETFLQIVSSGGHGQNQESSWKGDMGHWGNYLAFDVMGELTFGKNFEMLTSTRTRHIPEVIEHFSNINYIVRHVQPWVIPYDSIANISLGRSKLSGAQVKATQSDCNRRYPRRTDPRSMGAKGGFRTERKTG